MRVANSIVYASDGDEISTDGIAYSSIEGPLTLSKINYTGQNSLISTAMMANQREIYYYAFLNFPTGEVAPLNMAILETMHLLEETFAENATPLGAVSSNELTLSLLNQNKYFSPSYSLSPYYGKLLPNIPITVYTGILLPDSTIEYVALGIYYTTDWDAPTDSLMASVVCNDRLFNLFNGPMPQIPIQESANMSIMFTMLFTALNLTVDDFDIDALPYGVTIAALPEGEGIKIRDGLQQMSERCLCNVFVTRKDGKIRVLRNNNVEPVSYTWTDSDTIIHSDIETKYSNIMSQAEITYHTPYVGAQESVLTLESVEIPIGGITLNNLFFDSVVGAVENVQLIGATNSSISSMTIGARSISMVIENTGVSETVAITITGRSVKTVDAKYTLTDATAQAIVGTIKFTKDSEYIQSRDDAIIYAGKVLPLVTNTSAYIKVNSRGDPTVELTNSIKVNDLTNLITDLDVVPIRMENNFTNGLKCDMLAIKKSIREAS